MDKNEKNKNFDRSFLKEMQCIGVLQIVSGGYGFVVPEEDKWGGDIFVAEKNLHDAMNGDKVLVSVTVKKKGTSSKNHTEGNVISVIEEGPRLFIGKIKDDNGLPVIIPDDVRIKFLVSVMGSAKNAQVGDKVVFHLSKPPIKFGLGKGEIIEVIGQENAPGVDITCIVKANGIRTQFPDTVMKQVEKISSFVTDEVIKEEIAKGRHDLRNLEIVTIDSEDTKDVDDAISIERKPNGNYILGVHIADVTHYVTQDSPLDKEAYERGTSVYLPDRVIPMLPRELSNGICSLNEKVDRLAFTVMMEINSKGEIIDNDIFNSIINVKYKIAYNQIYNLYDETDSSGQSEELKVKYASHIKDLDMMKELASILHAKRHERGSLDFDFPETKVILDHMGVPIEIKPYFLSFANNIIEEFMLVCNETVAQRFFWLNVPFMYRVHGEPDIEKIFNLSRIVKSMGFTLKGTGKVHPQAIQKLLEQIKGQPSERVISTMTLRSLQKAEYKGVNEGHFGLALEYYTHFTSPIRRYPDLFIHRIMKMVLAGELNEEKDNFYRSNVGEYAKHCSLTERAADNAENESTDLKKAEFMKKFEGEKFEGVIANITSFGMFVELPNTVEGLVSYSSLPEYFTYDSEKLTAVGERSGTIFAIGDTVGVIVSKVDLMLRRVDFEIPYNGPKKSIKKTSGAKRKRN